MAINFKPLLNLQYWFGNSPPPMAPEWASIFFGVFGAMFLFGLIIRLVASRGKHDRFVAQSFVRLSRLLVVLGVLGIIIVFLSFEQIPFLGSRFWFLIWGLILIIWFGWIVRYLVKVVPKERQAAFERARREQYLPKSNSR